MIDGLKLVISNYMKLNSILFFILENQLNKYTVSDFKGGSLR